MNRFEPNGGSSVRFMRQKKTKGNPDRRASRRYHNRSGVLSFTYFFKLTANLNRYLFFGGGEREFPQLILALSILQIFLCAFFGPIDVSTFSFVCDGR